MRKAILFSVLSGANAASLGSKGKFLRDPFADDDASVVVKPALIQTATTGSATKATKGPLADPFEEEFSAKAPVPITSPADALKLDALALDDAPAVKAPPPSPQDQALKLAVQKKERFESLEKQQKQFLAESALHKEQSRATLEEHKADVVLKTVTPPVPPVAAPKAVVPPPAPVPVVAPKAPVSVKKPQMVIAAPAKTVAAKPTTVPAPTKVVSSIKSDWEKDLMDDGVVQKKVPTPVTTPDLPQANTVVATKVNSTSTSVATVTKANSTANASAAQKSGQAPVQSSREFAEDFPKDDVLHAPVGDQLNVPKTPTQPGQSSHSSSQSSEGAPLPPPQPVQPQALNPQSNPTEVAEAVKKEQKAGGPVAPSEAEKVVEQKAVKAEEEAQQVAQQKQQKEQQKSQPPVPSPQKKASSPTQSRQPPTPILPVTTTTSTTTKPLSPMTIEQITAQTKRINELNARLESAHFNLADLLRQVAQQKKVVEGVQREVDLQQTTVDHHASTTLSLKKVMDAGNSDISAKEAEVLRLQKELETAKWNLYLARSKHQDATSKWSEADKKEREERDILVGLKDDHLYESKKYDYLVSLYAAAKNVVDSLTAELNEAVQQVEKLKHKNSSSRAALSFTTLLVLMSCLLV